MLLERFCFLHSDHMKQTGDLESYKSAAGCKDDGLCVNPPALYLWFVLLCLLRILSNNKISALKNNSFLGLRALERLWVQSPFPSDYMCCRDDITGELAPSHVETIYYITISAWNEASWFQVIIRCKVCFCTHASRYVVLMVQNAFTLCIHIFENRDISRYS